jgi:hydrogenase maturation protease
VKKILIGGIGSVLLGDDGVGPYVAGMLEAGYRFAPGVTVADLGTPGLDLVAHLSGIDALILIDSVANAEPAGTVTLYRKHDIMRNEVGMVRMDPHSPALSESLLIAELAGEGPKDILLIGVTGQHYDVETRLSPPVEQACARAVEQALEELERLDSPYTKLHTELFSAWWKPISERCQEPSPAAG